jgi:hypothetical protein
MALGNHRKSIRAEIAQVTERVRRIGFTAVKAKFREAKLPDEQLSPGALLLLITGIPKYLNLEESIGVRTAHRELVDAFERYLDTVEPPTKPRRRRAKSPARR